MTSPNIIPPPANTYGRTAKQLIGGLGDIINNGTRLGTKTAPAVTPMETVTILSWPGFVYGLTNQPLAATDYAAFQRPWINPKGMNFVRLVTDIAVIGSANAILTLWVSQTPNDINSWRSPGRGGAPVKVSINALGPQKGILVSIDPVIKGDWAWKVMAEGGDAAATPRIGFIGIQFDLGVAPVADRWWWRTLTPSVIPVPDPDMAIYNFPSGAGQLPWTTPTPSAVQAAPLSLSKIKGSGGDSASTATCPNTHDDYAGPQLRIVGPPMKAQIIPEWTYVSGWKAQAPSAQTTGSVNTRVRVYRESILDFVQDSGPSALSNNYFFYVPRSKMSENYLPSFSTELGDRFVIEVSGNVSVAGSFVYTTQGLGTWIFWNGNYDGFGDEDIADTFFAASYTDLPASIQYTTKVA